MHVVITIDDTPLLSIIKGEAIALMDVDLIVSTLDDFIVVRDVD